MKRGVSMAKCRNCGNWGLFLKVDSNHLCKECAALLAAEEASSRIAEEKRENEEKRRDAIREEYLKKQKEELESFRKVFPLNINNPSIINNGWEKWSGKHISEGQIARQRRSLEETTPIIIRIGDEISGVFVSRYWSRIYDTTLQSCTCPDFTSTQLPCKHMYRLFYEANITETESTLGIIRDLPPDLENGFSQLTDDEKMSFLSRASYLPKFGMTVKISEVSNTIKSGLYVASEPNYELLLNDLTKDKIILQLAKKRVSGFAPSWTKTKLINWVLENQKEALKTIFPHYCLIKLSDHAKEWITQIKSNSHFK